jgi:hypothetical protein
VFFALELILADFAVDSFAAVVLAAVTAAVVEDVCDRGFGRLLPPHQPHQGDERLPRPRRVPVLLQEGSSTKPWAKEPSADAAMKYRMVAPIRVA